MYTHAHFHELIIIRHYYNINVSNKIFIKLYLMIPHALYLHNQIECLKINLIITLKSRLFFSFLHVTFTVMKPVRF